MNTPSRQSFTHVHSHTHPGAHPVIVNGEKPEEILIGRLVADLVVWIDSAWIIGLVRSPDAVDVIGVFSGLGDPALWDDYAESISMCSLAETQDWGDSQLRRHNLISVFLPIESNGQITAALAIGPRNQNQRYSASDISLMRDLGAKIGELLRAQTATARANDDLQSARCIQDRLLPSRMPRMAGIECSAQCERSDELGGDFFDFSDSSAAGLTASIGNVAVTGHSGAILMTGVQACLQSLGRHGVGLPELFGEVNRMFWEIAPENACATLFSARVCPGREQLLYINAGHQTSLIVRCSGRVDRLEPNAPVLGLGRGSAYRQRTAPFEPGDTLVAVGDAITQPAIGTDSAVCEAALIRMVQQNRGVRVRELPARIIDLIESFAGVQVLDRTVVVVHFRSSPGGEANRKLHVPIEQFATVAA
jgi:serine phosphatase RsbU (regulator of sigma subunit)